MACPDVFRFGIPKEDYHKAQPCEEEQRVFTVDGKEKYWCRKCVASMNSHLATNKTPFKELLTFDQGRRL